MYKLIPTHQSYHWGKTGDQSEVAALINNQGIQVDAAARYAELWMGAHVKSPSTFIENGKPSKTLYQIHPELKYLLKVLSVDTALSIQAHPNKSHAEKLHAARPDIYKDPNHKPEMCIALTPFEGLCGFRNFEEISNFLSKIPSLVKICQKAKIDNSNDLKIAFGNLMKADAELVASELAQTVKEIAENDSELLGDLLHRLNKQYPGDVGVFCIYFLNRVLLQVGECMFLSANVPHAYLDGNCVECMACSDNVVRAGLTPKLRDVPTLVDMLDYQPSSAEERKFKPENAKLAKGGLSLKNYITEIPDFLVQKISPEEMEVDITETLLENVTESECIYLCTQGSCDISAPLDGSNENSSSYENFEKVNQLNRGSVVFTPKNYGQVKISNWSKDFVLWRASSNFMTKK